MRSSKLICHIIPAILFAFFLMPTLGLAEDSVCIQCHGGLEGPLGEPVGLWQKSIHAQNGISCNDCHGGDPTDFAMAMDASRGFVGAPEYAAVPEFCGRCHLGVKDDYLSSAHGQALEAGGPNCVICHGNHAIQAASIDLINETDCSRCHEYARAAKVKEVIGGTEATLTKLESSVASLHRLGLDMERLKEDLFSQRNGFRRLFHTVKLEKIQTQKAEFDSSLAATKEQVDQYESDLAQRKLVGGAVVLLLLLGGCVALLIRRSYHEEE